MRKAHEKPLLLGVFRVVHDLHKLSRVGWRHGEPEFRVWDLGTGGGMKNPGSANTYASYLKGQFSDRGRCRRSDELRSETNLYFSQ